MAWLLVLLLAVAAGCASKPAVVSSVPPSATVQPPVDDHEGDFVESTPTETLHIVKRGETVWMIARSYGVAPEDVLATNRLTEKSVLRPGQRLVIPRRKIRPLEVLLDLPGYVLPQTPKSATKSPTPVSLSRVMPKPTESQFIWPLRGRVVSRYGELRQGARNTGVDIEAEPGAKVVAAKSGIVVFTSESFEGWGRVIVVDHRDGTATWYAHNAKILARSQDYVKQGQEIAEVGQSGRAQRPLLNFKIFVNDRPVNPLLHLK
ncbi:MAG: M23 family metallopeptidase [Planctomycetes bacterium]|nr:M23 family metallopeptidase [Planctomycetota bacterium]